MTADRINDARGCGHTEQQHRHTDADVELVCVAIRQGGMRSAHPVQYPAAARAVLDALAERGHGLAPVIAHQWSVRYPDGFVDGARFTEAGARQRAAELGGEVVYRAVGPWQPAERAVTGEPCRGCFACSTEPTEQEG